MMARGGPTVAQGHSIDEYLETIYFLAFPIGEYTPKAGGALPLASRVAEMLGVSRASAGEMLKRLETEGLIERGEHKEALLTPTGRERAERVVRRHRIIERLLTDFMGYTPAEAHVHADELGDTFTDEMIERNDVRSSLAILWEEHPEKWEELGVVHVVGGERRLGVGAEVRLARRPRLQTRRLPQSLGAVDAFPAEVVVVAAEVAVGGRLGEDRPAQVEVAQDRRRPQVEVVADETFDAINRHPLRPEGRDRDRDRVRDADRVRDVHLAAVGQARGDEVLRHVARRVRGRAVDLRRVLAGEGAAAVAGRATVGVED